MCTVSYLPIPAGGFIVTSNRDETPSRNAIGLKHEASGDQTLVFPVDPAAGGSWFAASDQGRVACLLNGAFEPFSPDPRYTYSRGQILLDATRQPEPDFKHALLSKTAPFTLVLADMGKLRELIWDGADLHSRLLDPSNPAFWSSVTLYPQDVRQWRRSRFDAWLEQHPGYAQDDIIEFHRYGSPDDTWNGFVMNRDERVRTLSITSAERQQEAVSICHADLLNGEVFRDLLQIHPLHVATD